VAAKLAHSRSGSLPRVRVGVTLMSSCTRLHLDAFCSALADASGLDVTGVGVWYNSRLLEALDVGDVDIAWLPPILAAQAAYDGRAVPIAIPVRGGVSFYSTALFAPEASPLRSAEDLRGARAAWVDRQSASGYLLIRAELRAAGVDLDRAFAENRFMGSHEAVVRAVIDGAADVGATFVYLDAKRGAPKRAGWGRAKVRVIAHAGPIPADVVAANTRFPSQHSRLVQQLLLSGSHAGLCAATRTLLGTEIFTPPVSSHLEKLTALLPTLDDHAQPRPSLWPRS
jgi:phosphate/phosphite/phosphonate ABC transporter binding protein